VLASGAGTIAVWDVNANFTPRLIADVAGLRSPGGGRGTCAVMSWIVEAIRTPC
jgi:hypothetical protein